MVRAACIVAVAVGLVAVAEAADAGRFAVTVEVRPRVVVISPRLMRGMTGTTMTTAARLSPVLGIGTDARAHGLSRPGLTPAILVGSTDTIATPCGPQVADCLATTERSVPHLDEGPILLTFVPDGSPTAIVERSR